MADKKITGLTYYTSLSTKLELPDDTSTVFAVDSAGLTYKAEKWQILSNELLSFRTFLKSFSGSVVYLWSYSGTGGSKKVSPVSPIYLNNSGSVALLGVGIATYSTPGVASFSSSHFTITSGSVTLKTIGHGSLEGLSGDDHIQYMRKAASSTADSIAIWNGTSGRYIKSAANTSINDNGDISANNIKTSRTANSIPKSDTNGFLNNWFKETVYLKVVPEDLSIPANTSALIKFSVPRTLSGRTIKYAVARIYYSTGTNNVYLKLGTESIATMSGSSIVLEDTTVNTTIYGTNTISVATGSTSGLGLDVYFEVE